MKKRLPILLLIISGIINAQTVNIPDAVFKDKLLESSHSNTIAKNLDGLYFTIDSNNDDEIQVSEVLQVSALNVFDEFAELFIHDLAGVEAFLNLLELNVEGHELTNLNITDLVNLTELHCDGNQLSSLDISQNVNLLKLTCEGNLLTSLDVTQHLNLTHLYCGSNQLTSIDVTENTGLLVLGFSGNQLTSIDVKDNSVLESLDCSYNQLNSLNVNQNLLLANLFCYNNQITNLDLNINSELYRLKCNDNLLTTLNVNFNSELDILVCHANPLENLFIKNGRNESELSIGLMPSLVYICADETQIESVQAIVNDFVVVDSNCLLTVDEIDINSAINVYPNPAHDILNIKAKTKIESVNIYDAWGREAQKRTTHDTQLTLDISRLYTGMYYIKVSTDSFDIIKKVIVE